MLAAASLVLLMTPALAFFYGGMTRSKSALNMMMTGFGALAVVGPVWMLWGYLETFGTNVTGIVGDPFEFFALHDLTNDGGPMAATGVLIGLFANVTCAADGVVTSYTWAPVGALNGRFYGGMPRSKSALNMMDDDGLRRVGRGGTPSGCCGDT